MQLIIRLERMTTCIILKLYVHVQYGIMKIVQEDDTFFKAGAGVFHQLFIKGTVNCKCIKAIKMLMQFILNSVFKGVSCK